MFHLESRFEFYFAIMSSQSQKVQCSSEIHWRMFKRTRFLVQKQIELISQSWGKGLWVGRESQVVYKKMEERWSMHEHSASGGSARASIQGLLLQKTNPNTWFQTSWWFMIFVFVRSMFPPEMPQKFSWGVRGHSRIIMDKFRIIVEPFWTNSDQA